MASLNSQGNVAYRITIEPVSIGSTENDSIAFGDGKWVMTPAGPAYFCGQMNASQITGIQGYIVSILSGANTQSIETAIAAIAT